MINTEHIYNQLPGAWTEVTLPMYEKCLKVVPDTEEGYQYETHKLQIISALTGVPADTLLELPIKDSLVLIQKLSFMDQEPEPDESFTLKLRKADEISLDSYIQLTKQMEEFRKQGISVIDMRVALKAVAGMNDQELDKLTAPQVMQGFFLLWKWSKKSRNYTIRALKMKLIMFQMKKLIPFKLNKQKV